MSGPLRRVEVRTPSRLHFGLFSFGEAASRLRHGGVGAMIDPPGVALRITPAPSFKASGAHAGRVEAFARRAARNLGLSRPLDCEIDVATAPRQHVGLGVGTQLGMAVAAGLCAWADRTPPPDAAEIAIACGRGARSAVGAHGFARGGLLLDAGRQRDRDLGALADRCDLPAEWRFVLLTGAREEGLASGDERAAFARTPAPPAAVTDELFALATRELLPAAREADYARYAGSLYAYGVLAGGCFAAVQGGPFASRAIADRVALIRSLGFPGCGQSSWGPTVFTITPSADAAGALIAQLRGHTEADDCELIVAAPNNTGASIRQIEF